MPFLDGAPLPQLAEAITDALVHAVWQDALIAALCCAALATTRGSVPQIRYVLGCIALALMAITPVATAVWLYGHEPAGTLTGVISDTARAVPASSSSVTVGVVAPSSTWRETLQVWALPVWLCGVLFCSMRLLASSAHTYRLRRQCEPAAADVRSLVVRLANAVGVRRSIEVCVCAVTTGPSTIGWLRPAVLLPPATLLGLTADQLEAVIAHELAHVRRHDYLVNIVQTVIETVLFYHPAVWWVSRRVRLERELCCDDVAVAVCGDAVGYAAALTQLARLSMAPRHMFGEAVLSGTDGPLVQRVQRLLAPAALSTGSPLPLLVAGAIALMATTVGNAWIHAQSQAIAASAATVTGTLYDPLGQPAADLPITLDNNIDGGDSEPLATPVLLETRTDANGRYRFDNVPRGSYVVTPAIAWARSSPVTVSNGGANDTDVRITFDTVVTGLMMLPGGRPPTASIVFPPRGRQSETLSVRGPEHVNLWNRPYPDALQQTRREGVVVVDGDIGTDGKATHLRVTAADHVELANAALAAIEQERWEPARVRGVAIEVPLRVTLEYRQSLR